MKGQDIVLLLKLNILRRREAGFKDWLCSQNEGNYKLDWDADLVGLFDDLKYYGKGYGVDHIYRNEEQAFEDKFSSNLLSTDYVKNEKFVNTNIYEADFLQTQNKYNHNISTAQWSYLYSMRGLADETGISKTEVSVALKRCFDVGLAHNDRRGVPSVNTKALYEFIVYGIRYVFPARLGEITRGITTSFAAPVLEGKLISAGDLVPVWPSPHGTAKGQAVDPLFKSVPYAVRRDIELYAMLALVDSIRLGQARERKVAGELLEHQLRVSMGK